MQLFSQYLRDLLQAKGLTVSALSRLAGIERTALSKTLTGQRVLPYVALDDLIYSRGGAAAAVLLRRSV